MNQSLLSQSIIERAIGVVKLDDATYESIEHDQSATAQAAVIVVVAGIAGGIGALNDGIGSLIAVPIGAVIGWLVASALIFYVGTNLLPSPNTEADLGQVLRLWGYATVPGIAAIVGFIPIFGPVVGLAAAIWAIVCGVKAIMHALEMSVGRAIATAIVAWIAAAIVMLILGLIFGVGALAFT